MKGLPPHYLLLDLQPMSEDMIECPARSIPNLESRAVVKDVFAGNSEKFLANIHELCMENVHDFSLEEIVKLVFSTERYMCSSFREPFERLGHLRIFKKIQNSFWRWGLKKASWNEIIDIYSLLQKFDLSLDDRFSVTIDFTTSFHERGFSTYARTFLDGVFAFLIHYRGKHVMTIGFSFIEGKRILIQQVQLVNRRGNRWLYQLRKNRLEFAIDCFKTNFPGYELLLTTGEALVETTMTDYQNGLDRNTCSLREEEERLRVARERRQYVTPKQINEVQGWIDFYQEKVDWFTNCIHHLEGDADRLCAFYANTGAHQTKPVTDDRYTAFVHVH